MNNYTELGKFIGTAAIAFAINRAVLGNTDVPPAPVQIPDNAPTEQTKTPLPSCEQAVVGGSLERPIIIFDIKAAGLECDASAEPSVAVPDELPIVPPEGQVLG